eukprot:s27_g21.t1
MEGKILSGSSPSKICVPCVIWPSTTCWFYQLELGVGEPTYERHATEDIAIRIWALPISNCCRAALHG